MNLKAIVAFIVFFCLSICVPCCALQITNAPDSPSIHYLSNSTIITHVFYCSLDPWDEEPYRNLIVTASSPQVIDIMPNSTLLAKRFLIPVTVFVNADGNDTTIPISFLIPPSKYATIGTIEIRYPKLSPLPTQIIPNKVEEKEGSLLSAFNNSIIYPVAQVFNAPSSIKIFTPLLNLEMVLLIVGFILMALIYFLILIL